jgi:hypothetical protein
MRRKFGSNSKIIALIVGLCLFAPFQMVFACDHMDGNGQPVCCCDEPGMMGSFDNLVDAHSPDLCCDVSVEEKFEGVLQGSHNQGYSLDHLHPPPLLSFGYVPQIPFSDGFSYSTDSTIPLLTRNPVYLLTNRFLV